MLGSDGASRLSLSMAAGLAAKARMEALERASRSTSPSAAMSLPDGERDGAGRLHHDYSQPRVPHQRASWNRGKIRPWLPPFRDDRVAASKGPLVGGVRAGGCSSSRGLA